MLRTLTLALAGLLASAASTAGPSTSSTLASAPTCGAHLANGPSVAPSVIPPAEALLAGYGTGGFPIRTDGRQAQAYFDNGMQLAHAFAHQAATAAFERAERLDPTCAMCVWGEVWSRGPTINFGVNPAERKSLARLADKAAALAAREPASGSLEGGEPKKERLLTAALRTRYAEGGGDVAFAQAMDAIARIYPTDNEIAVLTADAWMIPAAVNHNRDTLPRALALLEPALARNPSDTGAIHFYIHATEMDGVGAKALPYAERLQALAPAASHLVHMPSHTYFWTGRFRQAEQSNLDAVAIDKADAARRHVADAFDLDYHTHDVHFGLDAALMDGDARGGLELAADELTQLRKTGPRDGYAQSVLALAYAAEGRYAGPAALATLAEPAALPFMRAMWRYARGEAAARAGDAAAVRREAAGVTLASADLKALGDGANRAQAMVQLASLVLTARAAMIDHSYGAAILAYGKAAALQEAKLSGSRDPPTFWYPVRRSLAEALLASGRTAQARTEVETVLRAWPADPLSLKVLAASETAAGQGEQANRDLNAARQGWSGDLSSIAPPLV